jgi:hypothetical protein
VQFPNLPLIVGVGAGIASRFVHGTAHSYTQAVAYLGIAIWAYEELARGVNWFRRLLGLGFLVLVVVRVAHAIRT